MKRTKIICTLGPKTQDQELLEKMILAGMNVARFNFSHGTYEEHEERLELLRSAAKKTGIPVAAMLDTKGPEIRTGVLPEGEKSVLLEEGSFFDLTTEAGTETTKEHAFITYEGLPDDVEPGAKILIDDGLIELRVLSKDSNQRRRARLKKGSQCSGCAGASSRNHRKGQKRHPFWHRPGV